MCNKKFAQKICAPKVSAKLYNPFKRIRVYKKKLGPKVSAKLAKLFKGVRVFTKNLGPPRLQLNWLSHLKGSEFSQNIWAPKVSAKWAKPFKGVQVFAKQIGPPKFQLNWLIHLNGSEFSLIKRFVQKKLLQKCVPPKVSAKLAKPCKGVRVFAKNVCHQSFS